MGNRNGSLMSSSGRTLTACVVALAFAFGCREGLAQDPSSSCTPAVGRVVSLQGNVELQRAGGKGWEAVKRLDTASKVNGTDVRLAYPWRQTRKLRIGGFHSGRKSIKLFQQFWTEK